MSLNIARLPSKLGLYGLGLGYGGALSTGGGSVTPAGTITAARVRPDGWTMEVDIRSFVAGPAILLNPFTVPTVLLDVTSPGYDGNATLGTITRQVVANVAPTTIALRQPYPNTTTRVESVNGNTLTVTLVLSDHIYAGDTANLTLAAGAFIDNGSGGSGVSSVAGARTVTVGSTEVAPKAIANWATPSHQRATGSSFTVDLSVTHRHGQQGRMVACVEFIATGQTSGATVSVKSAVMVASSVTTRTGLKVPVFRGVIPLAGFTQGETVLVDAKAYSWVGGATSILQASVDGDVFPSPNLTTMRFVCDKNDALGGPYAYVSTTGSDTTGAVNANPATAQTTPFATYGKAFASGAREVRLMAGTHSNTVAWSSAADGGHWLVLTRDPALARSDVTITTGSNTNVAGKLKITGATLSWSTTVLDGGDTTNSKALWLDNCDGTGTGGNPFYRIGMCYYTNDNLTAAALQGLGNVKQHPALVLGCTLDRCGQHQLYASFGNVYDTSSGTTYSMPFDIAAASLTNAIQPDGQVLIANKIMRLGGGSQPDFGGQRAITRGIAIVGNVFERNATVNPALRVGGDSTTFPIENAVLAYNTVAGGRMNLLYQDTGSVSIRKTGVMRHNLPFEWNNKTDTFVSAPDGNRTGNWAFNHQVGWAGNVALKLASAGGSTPDPSNWAGGAFNRDTEINIGTAAAAFTNYAAISTAGVAGAGNGDYHIGSGSAAKNRVRTGMQMLPFDLDGVARNDNNTGAAGAYEAA